MKANKDFMTQVYDNVFDSVKYKLLLHTRPFTKFQTTFQNFIFATALLFRHISNHCSLEISYTFKSSL